MQVNVLNDFCPRQSRFIIIHWLAQRFRVWKAHYFAAFTCSGWFIVKFHAYVRLEPQQRRHHFQRALCCSTRAAIALWAKPLLKPRHFLAPLHIEFSTSKSREGSYCEAVTGSADFGTKVSDQPLALRWSIVNWSQHINILICLALCWLVDQFLNVTGRNGKMKQPQWAH